MEQQQRIASICVLYSCHGCKITDARVPVRSRGADENVLNWLADVQQTVGNHHSLNSPHCRSGACDLKIPLGKADGAAVKQKNMHELASAIGPETANIDLVPEAAGDACSHEDLDAISAQGGIA